MMLERRANPINHLKSRTAPIFLIPKNAPDFPGYTENAEGALINESCYRRNLS